MILYYNNTLLHTALKEVKEFNEGLNKNSDIMFEQMYKNKGIGLAANQIGLDIRLIVYDAAKYGGNKLSLVNPKIIKKIGKTNIDREGCLSAPGIEVEIKRFPEIIIEAQKLDGTKIVFIAKDYEARILQHEIDHINGIMCVDKTDSKNKNLIKFKLKQIFGDFRA